MKTLRIALHVVAFVALYLAANTMYGGPQRQTSLIHATHVSIDDSPDPVHQGDEVFYSVLFLAMNSIYLEEAHVYASFYVENGIIADMPGCTKLGSGFSCHLGSFYEDGIFGVGLSAKPIGPGPMVLMVWTDGGYGELSETTTVLPCSDEVPLQIAPATDATSVPPTGRLSWAPVDRGNYTVYLGRRGSGCSTIFGSTAETSLDYLLDANTAYEWRVEASTIADCPLTGTACAPFTTGNDCGIMPSLIEPLGGIQATSPITFRWADVPNATNYHVLTATADGPFIHRATTTGTSAVIALPPGHTRWYVSAEVAGCSDVRSPTASFEVTAPKKRRSAG